MRTRAGLTQQGLAERLGTSQAHISRIEAGHALPKRELAARIRAFRNAPDVRGVLDGILETVRRSPDVVCMVRPDGPDVRYVALSEGFRRHPQFSTLQEGECVTAENSRQDPGLIARLRQSGIFSGEVEAVETTWLAEVRGFRNHWYMLATPVRTEDNGRYLHCAMQHIDGARHRRLLAEWGDPTRIRRYR